MSMNIDAQYIKRVTEELIAVPSLPTDCEEAFAVLDGFVKELGYEMTSDIRGNRYMRIPGEDPSKTLMLCAHMDTIGLLVRGINPDGTLRIARLGGLNLMSAEGERVTVHTAFGKALEGVLYCDMHSVHMSMTAQKAERSDTTMHIRLNEQVKSAADVEQLGVQSGDFVSVEPDFHSYENGYILSRFLDDKACVACVLATVKALLDAGLKPAYDVVCCFTVCEETLQSFYLAMPVDEYIAVDIGVVGPQFAGTEHDVSIICVDVGGPYDRKLVKKLMKAARDNDVPYKADVYAAGIAAYGTDAYAVRSGGNGALFAALGPGVIGTHGKERTHTDALVRTSELLMAYVQAQ